MRLIRGNVEREVNDLKAEKFLKDGFKPVDEGAAVEAAPSESAKKKLEDMSVEELKTLAKENGLTGVSALNKKELIEIMRG